MFKKFIKSVLFPLSIMPLIGSCSPFDYFQKVMEYDKEVKLSDGSMIWVHIKRHYVRAGELGGGTGYLPKEVEIS